MRAKIALLLSVSLLTGAIAATAQPLPCTSVAPEVRERVREAGACRDATPEDVAPKGASPAPSSAVTMTLSDGTVVRVPSEISSTINDGRKRAATNETAKPKGAPRASAQSKPDASAGPASQKLKVPDVIGRSYVGAGNALAEFKVDRIETASAAPAGEVLAQEPAPATLVLPGSTISLRVSDGSLARAADTDPDHGTRHRARTLVCAGARSGPSACNCSCPSACNCNRPSACLRADRSACTTRSIPDRALGKRCAHPRRWRVARSVTRCTPDASVAATPQAAS